MLIVTYHAIANQRSVVSTTPDQLAGDLRSLCDAGFAFVSLDQCADWLEGDCAMPPRSVAVTFDDGYASVARLALPVLTRMSVPATVFVISGRVGDNNAWPGQWKSIAPMALLGKRDLQDIAAAGISIGAHSWSHPSLPAVDAERLVHEVIDSGDYLEQIIGAPVRHFAYPYGRRTAREVELVRQRYRTGVNASADVVSRNAPPHDLPRLDCHDLRLALRLRCCGSEALPPYLRLRRGLRFIRRQLDGIGA